MRWLLVALALTPSVAAADAVGPEDPNVMCPEGTRRDVNHCGTECSRLRCDTDDDCRGGGVCREVALCAEMVPYCGLGSELYERVYSACAPGCMRGSCQSLRACVTAGAMDAGGPAADSGPGGRDSGSVDGGGGEVVTYGCGCRVGSSRAAHGGLLTLALALLLLVRRSRG